MDINKLKSLKYQLQIDMKKVLKHNFILRYLLDRNDANTVKSYYEGIYQFGMMDVILYVGTSNELVIHDAIFLYYGEFEDIKVIVFFNTENGLMEAKPISLVRLIDLKRDCSGEQLEQLKRYVDKYA